MGKTRASSVMFAVAFVAVVTGMFFALGGFAYAANPSPASDQYDTKVADVTTVADVATVADPAVVADTSQSLPNTGLSLLGAAVLGGGLVAVGIVLRRREHRKN